MFSVKGFEAILGYLFFKVFVLCLSSFFQIINQRWINQNMSRLLVAGNPRKINLHQTLASYASEPFEQQRPHSTLSLVNRSKVSPSIYKYQRSSGSRMLQRDSLKQEGKKTHFYEFQPGIEVKGKEEEKKKKKYESFNVYNTFPKRNSSFLRQRNLTINITCFDCPSANRFFPEKKPRWPILNEPTLSAKTLDLIETNSPSKGKSDQIKFNTLKLDETEKRVHTSRTSKRFSQRFSPWDLQSGFGKIERF